MRRRMSGVCAILGRVWEGGHNGSTPPVRAGWGCVGANTLGGQGVGAGASPGPFSLWRRAKPIIRSRSVLGYPQDVMSSGRVTS